jgi:hypothetical protein
MCAAGGSGGEQAIQITTCNDEWADCKKAKKMYGPEIETAYKSPQLQRKWASTTGS